MVASPETLPKDDYFTIKELLLKAADRDADKLNGKNV